MKIKIQTIQYREGMAFIPLEAAVQQDTTLLVTVFGPNEQLLPSRLVSLEKNSNRFMLVFPLLQWGSYSLKFVLPNGDGGIHEQEVKKISATPALLEANLSYYKNRITHKNETRIDNNTSIETGIRFTQVLEAEKGTIFRFLLEVDRNSAQDVSFSFFDSNSKKIELNVIALSDWDYGTKNAFRLFSMQLPVTEKHFYIEAHTSNGVEGFGAMDKGHWKRLVSERDNLMINPAIDPSYNAWYKKNAVTNTELSVQRAATFENMPFISIVTPAYNTPVKFLANMIDSVLGQSYSKWELVLVNASPENERMRKVLRQYGDERIRIIDLPENIGIAGNTNVGINTALGDYIAFLDHDDMLTPDALFQYVQTINEKSFPDLIYCDEDSFRNSLEHVFNPLFKPDFNLDFLYSHNYFVHFLMVSRKVIERIELSPDEVSGAQDYDMSLKAVENSNAICHIPRILYHWRAHVGSTNGGEIKSKPYAELAGVRVLDNHFRRIGIDATAETTEISCVYRVKYRKPKEGYSVSVVLADVSGDMNEVRLSRLLGNNKEHIDEVVLVSPRATLGEFGKKSVKTIMSEKESSEVAMINLGIRAAASDLVLILGSRIETLAEDCISAASPYFIRKEVGVVGMKGFSRDGLVCHAGLCVMGDGSLAYMNQDFIGSMGGGYLGMAECTGNFSAVAGGCAMMRRSELLSWGLLGEEYPLDLSLVDLCFRVRNRQKLISFVPQAQYSLILDSPYRKAFINKESVGEIEWGLFVKTWEQMLSGNDMNINPNLEQVLPYFHLSIN